MAFDTMAWIEATVPGLSGVEAKQGRVGEEEEAEFEGETDFCYPIMIG